jgi:hypothetical protein
VPDSYSHGCVKYLARFNGISGAVIPTLNAKVSFNSDSAGEI